MTNVLWSSASVVSLGSVDLSLPFGNIGTGNAPIVSLKALIHGDELTGLFALYRFIDVFVPRLTFRGTVRIVPIANPLAAQTQTRTALIDGLDMNRVGVGNSHGQITERTAFALYQVVRDSQLVINFHEFEADTLLTCVFSDNHSGDVRQQTIQAVTAFSPEVIWSIPLNVSEEGKRIPSFDSMVSSLGTPVFSVELPRRDLLSMAALDSCLSRLIQTLAHFGVVESDQTVSGQSHAPRVVNRVPIYSPAMGIWKPTATMMGAVRSGQTLGALASAPRFEEQIFSSPETGFVLQMRPLEVVKSNAIVCAIGIPDLKLQTEVESIHRQLF